MARARGSQIYSPDIVEELKNAMAIESRAGQDDEVTFRQKMNALQRFLNHGISRFSIETWHHALTALFHAYQPFHHHNHHNHHHNHNHNHHPYEDDRDKPAVLSKLKGLGDLRTLSRDVMLQREGGVLREVDAQALKYLENFLVALHCVREAKACVADLHAFLYRYYYDPGSGREHSQLRSGQAMSRAGTMHTPQGGGAAASSYEASARQFGILTLQQMSGSTGHKLRRTVADMQEILARWDRLMTEGEIQQDDLDAESHQDLQMLSGTAAFEPVLRLMPDIFAKFYKCLELLKQWWVLAHEIYPELPINRPPTPLSEEESTGTVSRLESDSELSVLNTSLDQSPEDQVPLSEQLQKIEDSIQVKEDKLQSLNKELELLEERERYFESLKEAYDKVTYELEEQTRQRKELVTVREKETFPPHNQMVDVSATDLITASKPHTSPEELNEQVARAENEMQMLQFQQSLLKQDYMVQLEVRPSLIRFADDLRIKIAEAQNSLVEDKMERIKLQTLAGEETCIASPRSVSRSDRDPSPDTEDAQPQHLTADKAAERKQELTRLLHKPMREDTSGSSVTGQTTTIAAEAKRRRQSLPATRREDTADKPTPIPAIKIHHASPSKRTTSVISAQSPRKSPRGPTLSPISDAKPPQRTSPDADTQRGTEALFHRRAGKLQGHEAATERSGERRPNQADHPLRRPRAKSDSHTLKTDTNTLKVNLELSQRLKTIDTEEKSLPKVTGSKSSPRDRANSNESNHDSQAVSKKAKPLSVVRKTSTSKSPDDLKKNAVTLQRPKSDVTKGSKADDTKGSKAGDTKGSKLDDTKGSKLDDTKGSKPEDAKGSKADDTKRSSEAKKRISPTAHSTKVTEVKKHTDQTSSNPKPDNIKKEQGKPLPTSTARHTDRSPRGTEQSSKEKQDKQTDKSPHRAQPSPKEKDNKNAIRSPHGTQPSPKEKDKQTDRSPNRTQPSPKEKDDDKKRHTAASQKPAEKTPNKTTSEKSPQDDVRKDSNKMTSAHTKPDDKKGNRITALEARKQRDVKEDGKPNHKADDVRDTGKVTAQKPQATRRPNGVVAKK